MMKIKFGKILHSITIILVFCATGVVASINYDTAWTFVYDGGKDSSSGGIYEDEFFNVKVLPNGVCVCVGSSVLSNSNGLLIKIGSSGRLLQKITYTTNNTNTRFNRQSLHCLFLAKNGDYIIGGERYRSPWVMRLDSLGNIKSSTWYYDSIKDERKLTGSGIINSIIETSRGKIICTAGDEFPNNGGNALNNYAAYLEFDSTGNLTNWGEWNNEVGYKIAGFSIEEQSTNRILLAGNQAVFCIDSAGTTKWKKTYSFTLDGVGSEVNNITRAKKLRDGTLMVAGQAYEGNCWTNYKKLYYDAWWSPITTGGTNTAWDTAGRQGGDDAIYDFTQLVDGRLVFVGKKSSVTSLGGVWTFVTDSTGKTILWEKQINIPYRGADGRAPRPLSVCASPDSGFTIAGDYACTDSIGGMNAFVAHYIPSIVNKVSGSYINKQRQIGVDYSVAGSKVIFTLDNENKSRVELMIYNAAGKRVAEITSSDTKVGKKSLIWDSSRVGKGIYLYKMKINDEFVGGKVLMN